MPMKAPYRFIPFSGWVHQPEWGPLVSHDLPFEDGVSGWLDLEIEAKTPILIGGKREEHENAPTAVHFHQLPDGRHAIPGSSLRGAIRSVLEIAAFGRAAFVDDVRYGLRDLSGPSADLYRRRLDARQVQAGWLHPTAEGARIQPCDWARVHVEEICKLLGLRQDQWNGVARPKQRGHSYAERYALAGSTNSFRTVTLQVTNGRTGREAFASSAGGHTTKKGQLVLTAKPGYGAPREKYRKNREFFFYDPEPNESVWIGLDTADSRKVLDDFIRLNSWHVGLKQKNSPERLPGWDYLSKMFNAGTAIPVFYIEKPTGEIDAMGTSMMFRVAHACGTGELLRNLNPKHGDDSVLDFAALMFGRAVDRERENQPAWGLKGRVVFEPAVIQGKPRFLEPKTTVLASPRGQFYPAYVRQPIRNGRLAGPAYAAYTPQPDALEPLVQAPQLAGWKRYPAKPFQGIPGPGEASEAMRVTLHPLASETRFRGRVRFHNLKPEELGALVWALRLWAPGWGERPDLRHKLGMAKPYGLGETDIRITTVRIENNRLKDDKRDIETLASVALSYADRFARHMTDHAKPHLPAEWRQSEQVALLLAMANPKNAEGVDLTYMTLAEFQAARARGDILPPYLPDLPSPPVAAPARQVARAVPNFKVGDYVFHAVTGETGEILSLAGGEAEVDFAGDTDRVPLAKLTRIDR